MILVDTSVWVDHLHRPVPELVEALEAGRVVTHDFVIGELMCGQFKHREVFFQNLLALEKIPQASHENVWALIENFGLMGRGLGFVDMHILAACRLSGVALLTHDKRLHEISMNLRG